MRAKKSFPLFIGILIIADQITKLLIIKFIEPYQSLKILPFFQLVNVKNKGAAFGLFQSLGNTAFILISIIAILFILVMLFKTRDDRVSLSLILAGAVGNLIDRVRYGYVVDFIDLHIGKYHWPAFNIADSALSIGIFLLFLRIIFPSRRKEI